MACTGSGHGSSMLGSACICKQMSLQCSQNIQRPSHIIPVCKPRISLTYLVPLKSTTTYVGCRRRRRRRRSRRNHRSRRSRRNRRSRRSRRSEHLHSALALGTCTRVLAWPACLPCLLGGLLGSLPGCPPGGSAVWGAFAQRARSDPFNGAVAQCARLEYGHTFHG